MMNQHKAKSKQVDYPQNVSMKGGMKKSAVFAPKSNFTRWDDVHRKQLSEQSTAL